MLRLKPANFSTREPIQVTDDGDYADPPVAPLCVVGRLYQSKPPACCAFMRSSSDPRGTRLWTMELMQLEMFVAAVEEGSFRGAAERVFRTPPAVSMAISKLERELETPLFERSKRSKYRLTRPGEVLYHHATHMLSLRSEVVSAVGDICSLPLGSMQIGASGQQSGASSQRATRRKSTVFLKR